MATGTRKQQERQEEFWIATAELPRSAGHPFHERLNELLERTFAQVYGTDGMRRTHLRGHRNSLKRLPIQVAAFNPSPMLRREAGVGTPQGLQDRRNRLFSASGHSGCSSKVSGNDLLVNRPVLRADSGFDPCRTKL